MKHLIETTDLNSLGNAKYDRLILDSNKNEIIYKGGVYEYVDLGLSVKWAKCNVGATSETDYGDYFQWGSTTPNTADECTWKNAPFNNGSGSYDYEYFDAHKSEWLDNNDNLKPEFDAATQIMGGDWRMPTETEIRELINNTTKEWITNFNGSDVNGMKFISKADTTKYIFIPASGYRAASSFYDRGRYGSVWSSSLYAVYPNLALDLYFFGPRCIGTGNYGSDRYLGFVVRGVME